MSTITNKCTWNSNTIRTVCNTACEQLEQAGIPVFHEGPFIKLKNKSDQKINKNFAEIIGKGTYSHDYFRNSAMKGSENMGSYGWTLVSHVYEDLMFYVLENNNLCIKSIDSKGEVTVDMEPTDENKALISDILKKWNARLELCPLERHELNARFEDKGVKIWLSLRQKA